MRNSTRYPVYGDRHLRVLLLTLVPFSNWQPYGRKICDHLIIVHHDKRTNAGLINLLRADLALTKLFRKAFLCAINAGNVAK